MKPFSLALSLIFTISTFTPVSAQYRHPDALSSATTNVVLSTSPGSEHYIPSSSIYSKKKSSDTLSEPSKSVTKFQLNGFAQGTSWSISYYATDSVVTARHIDSILNALDSSLSLYKPYSLVSQFNSSGTGIKADTHLVTVINRSIDAYHATNGAFDITYKSRCRGTEQLETGNFYVIKKKPCISVDTDGIAQGYSVDVLASFLKQNGLLNFLVELGGEILVSGKRIPSNEPMRVGIEAPAGSEGNNPFIEKIITLDSGAITTSGNFRRKDHIVNPASGKPVRNELVSVTVFATDATTADAYDNALMVMGLKKGLKFVETKKEIAAFFIYRNKKGQFRSVASTRFKRLFANEISEDTR